MKRIIYILVTSIVCFYGCQKSEFVDASKLSLDERVDDFGKRVFDSKDDTYFVSEEDMKAYFEYKKLRDGYDCNVKEIEPFKIEDEIVFYVVNYEKGWEIISADKRAQMVLAKGNDGGFSMNDYESTPWGTWMYTIGMDISKARAENKNVSIDENDEYYRWTLISHPDILLVPPTDIPGHYELKSFIRSVNYDTDSTEHLTQTRWDQDGNQYVPLKSDTVSVHAPAGCVAVAGAQMLYFLHYKIGVPTTAPYFAWCAGDVNHNVMGQGGSSSAVWNLMGVLNSNESNILVAKVGYDIGTNYQNNSSGAYEGNLVSNVFAPFGLGCTFSSYSPSILKTEIYQKGIPVLVGAMAGANIGHEFIVDKISYYRNLEVYTYTWVYDNIEDMEQHPVPDYVESHYVYNDIRYIYMNWGWGNILYNDTPFPPSGDWGVGGTNYHLGRTMIYNFTIL